MEDNRFQSSEPPLVEMDVPKLRCADEGWFDDIDKERDELERVFNELNELERIMVLDQLSPAFRKRR